MIEFRKLGGGRNRKKKKKKKGESVNFSRVKFKDRKGREGYLRWKTNKASHTSNEAINTIYTIYQTGP